STSETRDTGALAPDPADLSTEAAEASRRLGAIAPRTSGGTSVFGPLPRIVPGTSAPFSLRWTERTRRGEMTYDVPAYRADARFNCHQAGDVVVVNGTRFRVVDATEGEHTGRYLVRADLPSMRHVRGEPGHVRAVPAS